jgi:hypothetical protein
MGSAGIIGITIEDEDIAHLAQRNVGTPVIQISQQDAGRIALWKGKKVFLDGKSKSIVFLQL